MKRMSAEKYLERMQEAVVDLLGKTVTRHLKGNEGFLIAALTLLQNKLVSIELRIIDVVTKPNRDEIYTAQLELCTVDNYSGALVTLHFMDDDFDEYVDVLEGIFGGVKVIDNNNVLLLSELLEKLSFSWADIGVRHEPGALIGDDIESYVFTVNDQYFIHSDEFTQK